MIRQARFWFALICFALLAVTSASADRPAHPGDRPAAGITVGEFALQVARLAAGPSQADDLSVDEALASLRRAGLHLTGSAQSVLTEADLTRFFRQAGIDLQISNPSAPVSWEKVGALLATFGPYLAARASDPARDLQPFSSEVRPWQPPSSESFNTCSEFFNDVPRCRACCLSLGAGFSRQVCGRLCGQARAGKASPSEPTP
jgi:hypothetical protein